MEELKIGSQSSQTLRKYRPPWEVLEVEELHLDSVSFIRRAAQMVLEAPVDTKG